MRVVSFAADLVTLFTLLVCLGATACSGRQHLAQDVVTTATQRLSLAQPGHAGLNVYVDASGSMRGFALAAAANRRGAGDKFGSLLLALRSLPEALPQRGVPDAKGNEATQPTSAGRPHVVSFGSMLNEQPSLDGAVDAALGRIESAVIPQLPPSADCSPANKWNGATNSRTNIDRFFSQASTCLDQVFEEVLAKGTDKLNIIVTDAEQNAPLNDRGCPNARNLGTIQSYLNKWGGDGRFAAVIAVTLPYQPWRADNVGSYCGCDQRLLFMYVLAPSADAAERVFRHVSDYWKGQETSPSYVPLLPRAAVSYTVRIVTTAPEPSPTLVFSSSPQAASDLEPADVGRLPQVWMQLNDSEGLVAFNVEKAGFLSVTLPSASAIDWDSAPLEWSDPIPLERDGQLRRENVAGPLSLIRVNDPLGNEANPSPAQVRMARFLGQHSEPAHEVKPAGAAPLRLRIRRTSRGTGCQWYLIEIKAPGRQNVAKILDALANVSSTSCVNWDGVKDQVNAVFQTGAVMRFLLHVDY